MNTIYADVNEDDSVDEPNFQWVVLASEVEEREAALREELEAESKGADRAAECLMEWRRDCIDLQQRLTIAEQRVGGLESAAREMLRIAGIASQGSRAYNRAIINLNDALNPAAEGWDKK